MSIIKKTPNNQVSKNLITFVLSNALAFPAVMCMGTIKYQIGDLRDIIYIETIFSFFTVIFKRCFNFENIFVRKVNKFIWNKRK